MNLSDRHSARLLFGLALLGTLAGCRSARYEPAGPQAMGYGIAAGPGRRDPVTEAPRLRGPSEPVPLTESDPSEGPVFPRTPGDETPERDPASGPTLRGFPVEEAEEDAPAYPGVNRRTSASTNSHARPAGPSGSRGTFAAAPGNPLSASHKMLGDTPTRRTSLQPAARVAALPAAAAERPALPVAVTRSHVQEADEPADDEPQSEARPERRPLPLTTRRSATAADANGYGSFDDAGSAGRSGPRRLSDPPRLLAPPGE